MRRVLWVGNDGEGTAVMRGILGESGDTLETVSSAESALLSLRENDAYDLLVLDWGLPGLDGVSFCRQVKIDPNLSALPILLMAGADAKKLALSAGLEAGADGYIEEPFDETAVRTWKNAALKIHDLEKALQARQPRDVCCHREILRSISKLSHAVNNPLQALYATVDMLVLSLPENHESITLAGEIFEHADRVAKLVAQASYQAKDMLGGGTES